MSDISADLVASGIDSLIGLVVPWTAERDYSILWPDQTDVTQAGPRPGVPEAQQAGNLAFTATGEQSPGESLEVQVWHPGHPRRKNGLGVLWKQLDQTPARDELGWSVPCAIEGWDPLVWSDSNPEVDDPHIITTQDEMLMLAYQRASGGDRVLYVRTKTPTGAWGSQVEVTRVDPTVTSQEFFPCLVELRSGDVLLLNWIESGGEAQIQVWRSTDDGVTWGLVQNAALDDPQSSAGGRMRAKAGNGQVLLLLGTGQFASDDDGATFTFINGSLPGSIGDVAFLDGKWIAFAVDSSDDDRLKAWSTSSAFTPLVFDNPVSVEGNTAAFDDDLSCWVGDGILYVMSVFALIIDDGTGSQDIASTGALILHRSRDGGRTFEGMGAGLTGGFSGATTEGGLLWRWGEFGNDNSNTTPRSFVGTFQAGRSVVSHQWRSQNANETRSLALMYLGSGSCDLHLPALTGFDRDSKRVCWEYTYLPFDEPDDVAWTLVTTTGSPTVTLEDGYLKIDCAVADNYYTRRPTGPFLADIGTAAQGHICRYVVKVESGGSQTTEDCILRLYMGDGTRDISLSLRFNTVGFKLYNDATGLALVGGDVAQDMTVPVEIYFSARVVNNSDNEVSFYYRPVDYDDPTKEWTGVAFTSIAGNTTAPISHSIVEVGCAVSTTTVMHIRELHFALEQTGDQLSGGFTYPDDLFPRPVSRPTWLFDGVRVEAVGGPGWRGDLHQIDTRYDHAIERILPDVQSSPRRGWRSTGITQADISFQLDADLVDAAVSDAGSDLIAVCVFGINWGTASVYGIPLSSGPDVILGNLSPDEGLDNLRWERNGNRVRPSSASGGSTPYVYENEFAGCSFSLSSTVHRKIISHSAGYWTDDEAQAPRFLLEGITGAEATSGIGGAIRSRNAGVLISLDGVHYSGFKLVIDAQTTVEGYFEIGTCIIGRVVVTAPGPANGRTRSYAHGALLSETEDRFVHSTVRAPQQVIETLEWSDLTYLGATQGDNRPQSFVKTHNDASAEPIASWADASMTLSGLQSLLDGPNQVVAKVRVPVNDAGSTVQLNRASDIRLGRLMGPISHTTTQGVGRREELVATGLVTFKEEV